MMFGELGSEPSAPDLAKGVDEGSHTGVSIAGGGIGDIGGIGVTHIGGKDVNPVNPVYDGKHPSTVHTEHRAECAIHGIRSSVEHSAVNPFSIAPMIGWTDRNWRFLFRHIARKPLLYTEMVMDQTILYNTHCLDDHIGFDRSVETPLALQLGGNCPEKLGKAVEVVEAYAPYAAGRVVCNMYHNNRHNYTLYTH
jgi:hypothetical protein